MGVGPLVLLHWNVDEEMFENILSLNFDLIQASWSYVYCSSSLFAQLLAFLGTSDPILRKTSPYGSREVDEKKS